MTTICVPVREHRPEKLIGAIEVAARDGDLVEIRVDYLPEPSAALPILRGLPDDLQSRMIITLRNPEQGGELAHNEDIRRAFWAQASRLPHVLFDVEMDLLQEPGDLSLDVNRVICSHHDFIQVPTDVDEIYERMAATQARIIKIAVHASDATDCVSVFQLLDRAARDGRELIAIAMGQRGLMTRDLGPARGSFLTYGSMDDESATAPGQIVADELRQLYRIDSINTQTQITGLIGNPVGHSISPHIHNAAFGEAGLNAVFVPIEVVDVGAFLQRMVRPTSREVDWNLRGLSVTAPHKSSVIGQLDWIDEAARNIGAVNTIVIEGDELHGYNTDAIGFIAPLKQRSKAIEGLRCAVIGAGGAARAAIWALKQEGADVTVLAREKTKAEFLSRAFDVKYQQLSARSFAGHDMLVNATPLGTLGDREDKTIVTAEQLRGVRLAYDLVYNPVETKFLAEARAAGCETIGGLDMLIGQAVEQFKLWTKLDPPADIMKQAAVLALKQ
jgi:3-dehydroquinate dehydratase/shikimate dehydrogenase